MRKTKHFASREGRLAAAAEEALAWFRLNKKWLDRLRDSKHDIAMEMLNDALYDLRSDRAE